MITSADVFVRALVVDAETMLRQRLPHFKLPGELHYVVRVTRCLVCGWQLAFQSTTVVCPRCGDLYLLGPRPFG